MHETLRKWMQSAAIAACVGAASLAPLSDAKAGGVPPLPSTSQYSEPSQIVGTINALINQLNGNGAGAGGYAAQSNGATSLGTFCANTAGASPQTCNGQRGAVAYTGLGVTTTGTVMTTVITDSAITTASVCQANWITAFTAGSGVAVATVVPTAGTLTVISVNAGLTTNAVTTGTLGFNCVQ